MSDIAQKLWVFCHTLCHDGVADKSTPIPVLNPDGLLPAGIHDCTLDELKAAFGRFQGNAHRPRLFAMLEKFLSAVRVAELVSCLLGWQFCHGQT